MKSFFVICRFALALAVLSFAASARASIVFAPSTASPNTTASANTGAYGSDANVSVGYSAYTYNYPNGYGGLDSGTGAGIYSDSSPYTEVMTFTANPGYTVTLNSFDLATYDAITESVNISVTGGATPYSLTGATPSTSTLTTYSPNETGTALTLTITNLYDVGLNEINFTESSSVPEPSTAGMFAIAGLMALIGLIWRRRKLSIKPQATV
jgi:hypothetical protein